MPDITIRRTDTPRRHVPDEELGFGTVFTDHMFVMDYEASRGWHDPRVVPYGPLSLDPAAGVLQYGQTLFEGLKAFAHASDGRPRLFRPDAHAQRLNASARRLCMPEVDPAWLLAGVRALVRVDAEWTPRAPGTSLYLRPTMIATEGFLGVRPSRTYTFYVLISPVGAYFKAKARALKLWVEPNYVRAVRGGIGFAKTGGNYAGSLLAAEEAKARGYDQVLWLDGVHRRFVEEVGTMNLYVRIDDEVITPPLEGSILPGVTRDSANALLREWGVRVSERALAIDEIVDAHRAGRLKEVFGTGTAAVIAPVGELAWGEQHLTIAPPGPESVGTRLNEAIVAIQRGNAPDPHGWLVEA